MKNLFIYNSLTQQKEVFKPITPNKVGIYVCGNTVYDDCHIGHARIFVFFDVLVRYLRQLGYTVTYVRNITDIDDKIINRALELKENYQTLTKRVIDSMHADAAALRVLNPDFEPRVTEHIPQIIALIQTLVNREYAYLADGDVYFDVNKFPTYGDLAHQTLENLQSGARVEINSNKHNHLDFALWKAAKPGEPFWPSPWGNGRPGWHIECSAMAKQYLGEHFDIHGGGADLQFPHHQNEVAQSEAANGCKFVNYWMHLGYVQINKVKMSKSLGNFFLIKDVLKTYSPEILRYFLIASHYRSPLNYSDENLENAKQCLERLYLALRGLPVVEFNENVGKEYSEQFFAAMSDDFNTPEALAVLFNLAREINREHAAANIDKAAALAAVLRKLAEVLGILYNNPEDFLQAGVDEEQIKNLIAARNDARKNKNWAEADRVREELTKMQITLEDTPQGTIWRKIN